MERGNPLIPGHPRIWTTWIVDLGGRETGYPVHATGDGQPLAPPVHSVNCSSAAKNEEITLSSRFPDAEALESL